MFSRVFLKAFVERSHEFLQRCDIVFVHFFLQICVQIFDNKIYLMFITVLSVRSVSYKFRSTLTSSKLINGNKLAHN